ncbi:MAG: sigma-54 dependent transcriptional regulator, partial [Bacteroidales bacterium]|nr:sigma-54 dependent transcriptional regulator [Bacteroidales bacterium]
MKKYGKMLIVDDSENTLHVLRSWFCDHFNHIDCEKNPNLIPSYISRMRYDVYIIRMNYKSGVHNGNEGIYWMNRVFELQPGAAVILVSANGNVETAVRAIKEGAVDFLLKPLSKETIHEAVFKACRSTRSDIRVAAKKAYDRRKPGVNIIGSSEAIKKVLHQVEKIARTDANVLITGENGTGKELVARAIHKASHRASGPFVSVDMGSITGTLFESELFGHTKGAFTDAHEAKAGRFVMADQGTLFLDEIGNLPLEMQPKILSALQNRQVVRVGSNEAVHVDIRLLTATNMPLDRMVREGGFREDLLYRFNTISIHVPALRERKSDIRPLFHYFKEKFESRYAKKCLEVKAGVFEKLESWHWPGNIRELEHAVEKVVIMCENGAITPDDFIFNLNGNAVLASGMESLNLEENEMRIINKAIVSCSGNLSQASRVLGITRKTLYNKINKYGI